MSPPKVYQIIAAREVEKTFQKVSSAWEKSSAENTEVPGLPEFRNPTISP